MFILRCRHSSYFLRCDIFYFSMDIKSVNSVADSGGPGPLRKLLFFKNCWQIVQDTLRMQDLRFNISKFSSPVILTRTFLGYPYLNLWIRYCSSIYFVELIRTWNNIVMFFLNDKVVSFYKNRLDSSCSCINFKN